MLARWRCQPNIETDGTSQLQRLQSINLKSRLRNGCGSFLWFGTNNNQCWVCRYHGQGIVSFLAYVGSPDRGRSIRLPSND